MAKYSKERLYEMMFKVGGMPQISESDLPPGFDSNDVTSLENFVGSSSVSEDTTGVEMKPADLRNIIDKRKVGDVRDREDPYIHGRTIEIIDKNGKEIDREWLRREMTQRPKSLLGTNEKVGKTGVLKISLPAYKGLYYDEKDKDFKVVNTCPNAGNCKVYCYQQKGRSVMYDTAVISKTRILNFLLNHWHDFEYKMIDEIELAKLGNDRKGMQTIVRWHDSGDFISDKYLELAMDIARKTPDVLHYAYTKMVSMVKKADVSENFIFRFSIDSGSPEADLINRQTDKHADVVPKQLFKDLMNVKKEVVPGKKDEKNIWHYNSPEALIELKK